MYVLFSTCNSIKRPIVKNALSPPSAKPVVLVKTADKKKSGTYCKCLTALVIRNSSLQDGNVLTLL